MSEDKHHEKTHSTSYKHHYSQKNIAYILSCDRQSDIRTNKYTDIFAIAIDNYSYLHNIFSNIHKKHARSVTYDYEYARSGTYEYEYARSVTC